MSYPKLSLRAALVTLVLLCVAVIVAIAPLAGNAQTAEPEEASTDQAESTAASDKSADDKAVDKPSSEVFIPSEDISEDFAVSFPVDI